jgi:Dolichyl-phosphate-mannose-protein mannosyltransferase
MSIIKRSSTKAELPHLFLILLVHASVWALAAWLSRSNLDLPGDMSENYAWGIAWRATYFQHPPIFAWMAYFFLSSVNAAAALTGVYALARQFLRTDLATLAALALAVSPVYTSLAIKFNANSVLLALWPWAAFFWVSYIKTGRGYHLVVCAVFCALSMLGKYFSGVFILSLLISSLVLPSFRAKLKISHLVVAMMVGLLIVAPHFYSVSQSGFTTLKFAQSRSSGEFSTAAFVLVKFIVAQAFYMLPSLIVILIMAPSGRRLELFRAMFRGLTQPSRNLTLWLLTWVPLLVVASIALLRQAEMAAVWGLAMWFAFSTWVLALQAPEHWALRHGKVWMTMAIIWSIVLVLSVIVGWSNAKQKNQDASEPRAELAMHAEALWKKQTNSELRVVSGTVNAARAIVFYAQAKPRWWNLHNPQVTPWILPGSWNETGMLIVCEQGDDYCQSEASNWTSQTPHTMVVKKVAWMIEQNPKHYLAYIVQPGATVK